MKIRISTLTTMAREGRLSLQVPQYTLYFDKHDLHAEKPAEDTIDAPEEWFWSITYNGHSIFTQSNPYIHGALVVGKEQGFTMLSPAGYAANKERLRAAFNAAVRGHSWEDFEKYAQEFFQAVKANTIQRMDAAQKKLEQHKEAVAKITAEVARG